MILYLKDPKKLYTKTPRHHKQLSKVAGYKINLQKSLAFLYTNNKQTEKGYMETISFTIASKKIKYLGVNLTKDVNDFYKENDKLLKKEITEDYRRWKDLPCSWICKINIAKIAILAKVIYMFNAIPTKIPMTFITEIEKSTLKFIWKQETVNRQGNTQQNEQCWRYHNTQLQSILQSNINKNSLVLAQRHEDQWNRIEDPDMNPHSYTHLIFDKGAKNIRWRKGSLFNKCCWKSGYPYARN
jgi:hypothetical protein